MENAFDLYAKVHTVGVDMMVKHIGAGLTAIAGMVTRLNNQQRGTTAAAMADEVRSRYNVLRFMEEQQIRSNARIAAHQRAILNKALGVGSTQALRDREAIMHKRDLALAAARRKFSEQESREMQEIGASAMSLGPALAAAALAATAIVGTLADMFKRTVQWESSMVRTIALIGEGKFAVKSFYDASRDSLKLGVNPQEMHQVLQVLAAAKTPSETLVRDAKNITRLSAVSGSAIGDLVKIYAEVNNKQQVYREDLLQFSRRNIPLADALRSSLGVTHEQLKDMVTEGKIGFAEFSEALDKVANDANYFGSAVSASARTSEGVMRRVGNSANIIWTGVSRVAMTGVTSWMKSLGAPEAMEFWATKILDNMEKADTHLALMLNKERELGAIAEKSGKNSLEYRRKLVEIEKERISAEDALGFGDLTKRYVEHGENLVSYWGSEGKSFEEVQKENRQKRVEQEAESAALRRRAREAYEAGEARVRAVREEAAARAALIDQLKLQGKTEQQIEDALKERDRGAALRLRAKQLQDESHRVMEAFASLAQTDLGDPAAQRAKKIYQVARQMRDEMGVTVKELQETFELIWASPEMTSELKRFLPDVDLGNKQASLSMFMSYASGAAEAIKGINRELDELNGKDPVREEIIKKGGNVAEYDAKVQQLRVTRALGEEEARRRRLEVDASREGLTADQLALAEEMEKQGRLGAAQRIRDIAVFNQLTDQRETANNLELQQTQRREEMEAKRLGISHEIYRMQELAKETGDRELEQRAEALAVEERRLNVEQQRFDLQHELAQMLDPQVHAARTAADAARDEAKYRLQLRDSIAGVGGVEQTMQQKTAAVIKEMQATANPLQTFHNNQDAIRQMLLSGLDPGRAAGTGVGAAAQRSAQQAISESSRRHKFQTEVLQLMEAIEGVLKGDVEATKDVGKAINQIEAKAG